MFKTNLSTIILISLIVIINTPISSQAKTIFNPCPSGSKTGCTPKGPTGGGSRKRITTALIIKSKPNTKKRYIPPCKSPCPDTVAPQGAGSR